MAVMTRRQKMRSLTRELPQEVIHDIISRLRIKSLLRFRCVSKSWLYFLSFDPHFKKLLQINNTKNNPGIIALTKQSRSQQLYYAADYTACDEAIKFDIPFDTSCSANSRYDYYQIYGICNGLICLSFCYFNSNKNYSKVYLWNPLTSDHIIIPCPRVRPPVTKHAVNTETSFGFGYDEGSNEYKVIRLAWASEKEVDASVYINASMYTLGTNTWKFLKEIPYNFISYKSRFAHVPLVNGALHWHATKSQEPSLKTIISFDIKNEVFQEIPLPNNVRYDEVSLGELGGSLSIFCDHKKNIQIWVMEEYGVVHSWRKLCVIERTRELPHLFGVIGLASNREIIIKSGSGDLSLYNSKSSLITELQKSEEYIYAVFTYFGRLTSLRATSGVSDMKMTQRNRAGTGYTKSV